MTATVETKANVGATRLVVIRHGEAICNVNQIVGGMRGCTGLTPKGVRQAELLAERLLRTGELAGASALWASVLPRAAQTAEIIRPALGLEHIDRSDKLREQEPGEADGLSWAEFELRYRKASAPGTRPDEPIAPGGESWFGFIERASSELRRLVEANSGGLVVVVAHGGVIDSSMISFLDLPEAGTKVRLHPEHTSLTEWRHTDSRWRLVRYNDAAHLHEPAASDLRSPMPEWVNEEPGPTP